MDSGRGNVDRVLKTEISRDSLVQARDYSYKSVQVAKDRWNTSLERKFVIQFIHLSNSTFFVVIEMAPVTYIDSSAAQALKELYQDYKSHKKLYLWGLFK